MQVVYMRVAENTSRIMREEETTSEEHNTKPAATRVSFMSTGTFWE